jgi:hypothetical protein
VTTRCQRCGELCQFTGPGNPEARVLRRSATPEGLCASCCIAHFLQTTEPLATVIAQAPTGPCCLLEPAVQAQVGAMLRAGNADADPSEINWTAVVNRWPLPFPKPRRR